MVWQAYLWVWRLESPLHVGFSPAGFLNRTRLYIPARTMWGALTAELARRNASGAWPDYQGIGRDLQKNVRFSYLYPAEQVNGPWHPWLPRYEKGQGLCWQRQDGGKPLMDRSFRQHLLSTQSGTAIDPHSDTAAEGTLREVEYIMPRWRYSGAPLGFVGYVLLRHGSDPHGLNLRGLMNVEELWVGGESRYGFGRLHRVQWEDSVRDCFGISLDLSQNDPILSVSEFVWAHVPTNSDSGASGAWEILLGWDRDTLDSRACSNLCWAPGSRVSAPECYRITENGIWESLKQN
jgi:hypothetical protein